MWQITWMLSLLPDWVWFLVLIAGILGVLASWVLKFIPFISNYRLPIQVVSVLLLLVGVYFQGVIANEEKYKAEHERLTAVIEKFEAQSKEVNTVIQKEVVEKTKIVKEKGETQIKYIDKIVQGDPVTIRETITKDMTEEQRADYEKKLAELQNNLKNCPIPQIIIDEHNKAALMGKKPAGDKK